MDFAFARSRPRGVLAVVVLTVLYGIERLASSLLATGYLLPGRSSVWAGVAGCVVAYLLWRGAFVGWAAAVVLYALLTLDFALGAAVFGLTRAALTVLTLVVLAYLTAGRSRFRLDPALTRPSTEQR